ncbi:hypothetical protein LC040_03905 [Bacillus tianshenii]|nr:hypothetical protein LC040_03905 [Bacillus tianshenii]
MGLKRLPLVFFMTTLVILFASILSVIGGTVFHLYPIGPVFIKVIFGIHIVVLVAGATAFVFWGRAMRKSNS